MPRRRSSDPTTAISITLTRSLLDEIDDQLTRVQSRSAWIASACQAKLAGEVSPADFPTSQLLAVVLNRGHITENMFQMCNDNAKLRGA